MNRVMLVAIVLFFVPFLALAEDKSKNKKTVHPLAIRSSAFKGFDKCSTSQELSEVREKLFSTRKPIK